MGPSESCSLIGKPGCPFLSLKLKLTCWCRGLLLSVLVMLAHPHGRTLSRQAEYHGTLASGASTARPHITGFVNVACWPVLPQDASALF